MFAIIDIESCSPITDSRKNKIIEISILIHDGLVVVEEYTTLVNPECTISSFYSKFSGITNQMVKDAPKFYEIAKKIIEITENKIFVAHNVKFDYHVVKNEFEALGYEYKRKELCTVKLSRKLLPGLPSYSLGNLCMHLQINNQARHRAYGDALATAQLFDMLLKQKSQNPKYKNKNLEQLMEYKKTKFNGNQF